MRQKIETIEGSRQLAGICRGALESAARVARTPPGMRNSEINVENIASVELIGTSTLKESGFADNYDLLLRLESDIQP